MTKDKAVAAAVRFGLLPGEHMIEEDDDTQFYKKPWVGLTEEEIYEMYNEPRSDAEMVAFARAIEQRLKEKNT